MNELILIGDRVLIRAEEGEQQTKTGLILPASVAEKERVHSGRVQQVGPGYLMANPEYSEGEPWAPERPAVRYLPLQARPGDFAFFLRDEAIEITFEGEAYLIVPHRALLALVRTHDEDLPGELDIDDLLK